MMSYPTITLDLIKQTEPINPLFASRGDKGIPLKVLINSGGNAQSMTGWTAQFNMAKPSGHEIIVDDNQANYQMTDTGFTYTMPEQAYQVSGKTTFNFTLTSPDGVQDSTEMVDFTILPTPTDQLVNSSYIPQIDKVLEAAKETYNEVGLAAKTASDFVAQQKAAALTAISDAQKSALQAMADTGDTVTAEANKQKTAMQQSAAGVATSAETQTKAMAQSAADVATAAKTQTEAMQASADAAKQSADDAGASATAAKQSASDAAQAVIDAGTKASDQITDLLADIKKSGDDAAAKVAGDGTAAVGKVTKDGADAVATLKQQATTQAKAAQAALDQLKQDKEEALKLIASDGESASAAEVGKMQAAYDTKAKDIDAQWATDRQSLLDEATTLKTTLDGMRDTDLPAMTKQIADTQALIDKLTASEALAVTSIKQADGTALTATAGVVTLPDYALANAVPSLDGYLTADVASKTYATKTDMANAGKVKTVAGVAPDAAGNVSLDMSKYLLATDATTKYQPIGSYQAAGDYATNTALAGYQLKGDYALKSDIPTVPSLDGYALKSEVPSLISSLELNASNAETIGYIDFHTQGTNNDYDVRVSGTGGTAGNAGQGALSVEAAGGMVVNGQVVATQQNVTDMLGGAKGLAFGGTADAAKTASATDGLIHFTEE